VKEFFEWVAVVFQQTDQKQDEEVLFGILTCHRQVVEVEVLSVVEAEDFQTELEPVSVHPERLGLIQSQSVSVIEFVNHFFFPDPMDFHPFVETD